MRLLVELLMRITNNACHEMMLVLLAAHLWEHTFRPWLLSLFLLQTLLSVIPHCHEVRPLRHRLVTHFDRFTITNYKINFKQNEYIQDEIKDGYGGKDALGQFDLLSVYLHFVPSGNHCHLHVFLLDAVLRCDQGQWRELSVVRPRFWHLWYQNIQLWQRRGLIGQYQMDDSLFAQCHCLFNYDIPQPLHRFFDLLHALYCCWRRMLLLFTNRSFQYPDRHWLFKISRRWGDLCKKQDKVAWVGW